MSEVEADLDSLIDDVPLDGEHDEPKKPVAKDDEKGEDLDMKKVDKATDAEKARMADKIDQRIQKVLKENLPKPEAAMLMVDILCPGEAVVAMKADFNLSPRNHFLIAAGGILLVALATNPEIMQKLRTGFTRNKKADKKPAAKTQQRQLPAKTEQQEA